MPQKTVVVSDTGTLINRAKDCLNICIDDKDFEV